MAKLLLDNLMKVFKATNVFTGVTIASVAMDFDIPRGFVIRLHEATLAIKRIAEDIEGIAADKVIRYKAALVKDPDDTTTITIPGGVVDHDVLMDIECDVLINFTADSITDIRQDTKTRNFTAEGLDVITARNMRLNVDVEGTDAADGTEAFAEVVVNYTLERIVDADILALLDIL